MQKKRLRAGSAETGGRLRACPPQSFAKAAPGRFWPIPQNTSVRLRASPSESRAKTAPCRFRKDRWVTPSLSPETWQRRLRADSGRYRKDWWAAQSLPPEAVQRRLRADSLRSQGGTMMVVQTPADIRGSRSGTRRGHNTQGGGSGPTPRRTQRRQLRANSSTTKQDDIPDDERSGSRITHQREGATTLRGRRRSLKAVAPRGRKDITK